MATDLAEALDRLHIASEKGPAASDGEDVDGILSQPAARVRQREDPARLKADLEKKYLSPSTTFSTDWLNRLQQ